MLLKHLKQPHFGICYEESSDKGGGGKDDDKKKHDPDPPVGKEPLPDHIVEGLENLIEKAGNPKEGAKMLYEDNKALRDKNRELKEKVLDEDQVAVSKETHEVLEQIREMGGIEVVQEKLETIEEKEKKIKQFEHKQTMTEIGDAYGWNSEVLADMLDGEEIETESVDDEDAEQDLKAYIKTDDGKVELSKFIEESKSMYKPALETNGSQGGGKRITRQDSNQNNGKSDSSSVVDEFKNRRKEEANAGNPLAPKQDNDN